MTHLPPYSCPFTGTYDFQIHWRFYFSATHGKMQLYCNHSPIDRRRSRGTPSQDAVKYFEDCMDNNFTVKTLLLEKSGTCLKQVSLQIALRNSVHLENLVIVSTCSLRLITSGLTMGMRIVLSFVIYTLKIAPVWFWGKQGAVNYLR